MLQLDYSNTIPGRAIDNGGDCKVKPRLRILSGTSRAVLNAYDAANVATQLYSSPISGSGAIGNAVKFTVSTVANRKVYVGTQGRLEVFGLLPN
jgi:hypothetical protein